MNKRLLNLLAAVSLSLACLTIGLWIQSHFRLLALEHFSAVDSFGVVREWRFGSVRGRAYCERVCYAPPYSTGTAHYYVFIHHKSGPPWLGNSIGQGGFDWQRWAGFGSAVAVPYWFLTTVLLLLPVGRWRKRKGIPDGCCGKCGYDLRATPERCPECGSARVGIF